MKICFITSILVTAQLCFVIKPLGHVSRIRQSELNNKLKLFQEVFKDRSVVWITRGWRHCYIEKVAVKIQNQAKTGQRRFNAVWHWLSFKLAQVELMHVIVEITFFKKSAYMKSDNRFVSICLGPCCEHWAEMMVLSTCYHVTTLIIGWWLLEIFTLPTLQRLNIFCLSTKKLGWLFLKYFFKRSSLKILAGVTRIFINLGVCFNEDDAWTLKCYFHDSKDLFSDAPLLVTLGTFRCLVASKPQWNTAFVVVVLIGRTNSFSD